MAVPEAVELVDLALKATTAYERPDLAQRLNATRARLADPNVRVLVVGEFKQGKSQLVNALVNATGLPGGRRHRHRRADAGEARSGDDRDARARVGPRPPAHRDDVRADRAASPTTCPRRATPATRPGSPTPRWRSRASCWRPAWCWSTPPGSAASAPRTAPRRWPRCRRRTRSLLVSDAAQEYTGAGAGVPAGGDEAVPERRVRADQDRPLPALASDRRARRRAPAPRPGSTPTIFPVSSALRLHAAAHPGQGPDRRVRLPGPGRVPAAQGRRRGPTTWTARSVGQDVLGVCEQLSATMRAELAAQEDPERAAEPGRRAGARRRRGRTRSSSAPPAGRRRSTTGSATCVADIEYDLRDRLRTVSREAEQLLDDADPADIWDQFAEWFHQQVSRRRRANFVWADRARPLAGRAGRRALRRGRRRRTCPTCGCAGRRRGRARSTRSNCPTAETFGAGQKLFVGIRGGYGGMLMIGMASTVAGLALLNPLSHRGRSAARRARPCATSASARCSAARPRPRRPCASTSTRSRSRSARTPGTCCARSSASCATTSRRWPRSCHRRWPSR